MTDDAAFLQAIRAAPNDDAPRLICADWLEERGQTERAEFIRIQCRLSGMPDSHPNAADLKARAEKLLRANWEAWIGPLRELVGPRYDRYGQRWMGEQYNPDALQWFRRGFVESITLDAERFLAHGSTLLALVPLRGLGLKGAGRCARALANCSCLAGLEALIFSDYWMDPLTASDAPALATSPYLHGLTSLILGWNSLSDTGVEALMQAPWLESLRTLDLSNNGLTDTGALALANCLQLGRLQTLFVSHNAISDRGNTALRTSPHLRQLTHLELND